MLKHCPLLVFGGAEGGRTPGLDIANVALSQLSYGPMGAESNSSGRQLHLCVVKQLLGAVLAAYESAMGLLPSY